MCRHNCNCCAKSSQEEVISAEEGLLVYCKPVRLYNILHLRSQSNRSFLARNLKYRIRAKAENRSRTGRIVFKFKDCNNAVQKTEIRDNYSCPFCYMMCGSFRGLQLHLNASHELFESEFVISEGSLTVNISLKLEEEGSHEDKFEPLFYRSKTRKHRQSGNNNAKRFKASFLPMDLPSLANGTGLLNDELAGQFGMASSSSNPPPAPAQSAMSTTEAVVVPATATKTRKLAAERSEARSNQLLRSRQFYHSHTFQPMSLEQVLSGQDSEDELDPEVADFEDSRMLDDFVDVSKDEKRFMHIWNSFVRKQRVLADGHVPWCCEALTKFHKEEFNNSSRLSWCWRLFLVKLWNLGLVDARTINNCTTILLEKRDNNSDDTNNNNSVDDINNNKTDEEDINSVDDINKKKTGEEDNNNRDEQPPI
uniref:Polycomb group protein VERNALIZATION 2 n=1 Tax=Noccaea caerulescens TaxID=107243 RepID=A0A1J3EKG6_NOCCA